MPIKVPKGLPAVTVLQTEGITVMADDSVLCPRDRPLHVGLLNLMPNKIETEIQIARLLGATPILVDLTLIKIASHSPKNTPVSHLTTFYRDWIDVMEQVFDGFIITGAPVESIPFEQVAYWNEFVEILNWTQTNARSCFNICWAAQAAMHHFHGLPKYALTEKAFGIFRHRSLESTSPYLQGFSDDFFIPVSRWTEMRSTDIPSSSGISVLMESPETGLCLLDDPKHHSLHIFNHIEYDSQTLADEYFRDRSIGRRTSLPKNYLSDDYETLRPRNCWRSHAHLLFGNWVGQIYKTVFNTLR
ncbi:homoserine O-succinyltransferase [Paraburkholderia caribensis]|uniref:Homoserine O-acetyltransferase n=2 Tax=Paraburkholderia TaxID=1822464 RepID=B2JYF8_PARP8|nr:MULTISPECIES: homoserine O-succinyltransferase [Paraburkholderia]ACC76666.1 Homoserine O-succinyltransferase [Paraburkholderia phymatum STM815]MCO4882291.1 homoserine O-succinyltransferase [Paraburkholderia caribensis]PTB24433.1 homoserine O-succinyltransferase [Paraburkholderia caribensis]